ncbi:4'-phosphopantetheinyl transferase superfamily protein [bacterium]|nr:4'-phosphopantetheinyl transferase superfamily protein [bacterium]
MDNTGRVTERISGVEKLKGLGDVSDLSEPIWELLRENPRQAEIKRLLSYHDKLILAQVPISLIQGALETDENGLLSEQLAEEENKQYYKLKHAKRRLEWLAGRIVSKAAVRIYLDKGGLLPSDIIIRSLPSNSPYIIIDQEGVSTSLPYISISHSNDIAVAVAAQTKGIGIDAEKINDSILEIADEFSAEDELKLIIARTGFMKVAALTSIWAMKEASLKAAGPEVCLMKELILKKAGTQGNYIVCEFHHSNIGYVKSVAFQSNEYIYAVSILAERKM